jgi:hypothetical protein
MRQEPIGKELEKLVKGIYLKDKEILWALIGLK